MFWMGTDSIHLMLLLSLIIGWKDRMVRESVRRDRESVITVGEKQRRTQLISV